MKKTKKTYISVSLPKYLSVVNYLRANGFKYYTDNNTGNMVWRDSDNHIVAKRTADKDLSDIYLIDNNVLNILNDRN